MISYGLTSDWLTKRRENKYFLAITGKFRAHLLANSHCQQAYRLSRV